MPKRAGWIEKIRKPYLECISGSCSGDTGKLKKGGEGVGERSTSLGPSRPKREDFLPHPWPTPLGRRDTKVECALVRRQQPADSQQAGNHEGTNGHCGNLQIAIQKNFRSGTTAIHDSSH